MADTDLSWVNELRNIWVGTMPPPSSKWEWIRTPDSLVVNAQTGYLAIEWEVGDGIEATGLDVLKVMVSRKVLPWYGICVFEQDPMRRAEMVGYLKQNLRKVGANPEPFEPDYWDRIFALYESADMGKTWVQVKF